MLLQRKLFISPCQCSQHTSPYPCSPLFPRQSLRATSHCSTVRAGEVSRCEVLPSHSQTSMLGSEEKKKRQHTKLSKSVEFRPNCPGQGYNIPQEVCTAPTSDPSQKTSLAAAGEPSSEQQIKLPSIKPQPASTQKSKVQEAPSQTSSPKAVPGPVRESKTPAAWYCGLNVAYRVPDPPLPTFKLRPRVCFSQKRQSPGLCTPL